MDSISCKLPPLLSNIHSSADLRKLSADELNQLAQEIRSTLISTLSRTGGHLAPNLGVVELSIALHRVFNTPVDKILFDVSHQCYVHKMLTGRAATLDTIRQFGGISGFMKRSESEHDAFGAGHAGTALSAGLGMAVARDLNRDDYNVISVVGDGAFGCGTTLEGLNSISSSTKRFILVLNDNKWSIDKNVGALSRYFSSLQETDTYNWLRDRAKNLIQRLAGQEIQEQAAKIVQAARSIITPSSVFSALGLNYYGPIDGHDIRRMERIFRLIATRKELAIVHIITEKGKGYLPAAQNPTKFHGVGQYNVVSGATKPSAIPTYSEVFGQSLTNMAEKDPAITAITAAMPSGTKLDIFRSSFPKRFFDVGIAEEHAALYACGLATQGLKPYLAIYSTFMQRCVDMIQHDAALQKLPVRFCMDRAGLSPDDGPTHHGVFDISMMRCIPGLVMMQPRNEAEFACMLRTMNEISDCPSAIRYPRGAAEGVEIPANPEPLPIGKAEVLADGKDVALVALGNMNTPAETVREALEAQGLSVAHINARFIKPLDGECLRRFASSCRLIVTLEDHVISGGFGSAVMEELAGDFKPYAPVLRIGWPDEFVIHGTQDKLRELHGLNPEAITAKVLETLQKL